MSNFEISSNSQTSSHSQTPPNSATSNAATQPYWATVQRPHFPPLDQDVSTDVCIVGAGIAGLTTAYLLQREGKRVVVLEKGEIASGESGRTTAHITHALDDRYFELEHSFGRAGARAAADSHTAAIDTIEAIVRENGIDCDFERVDGYLFAAPEQSTKLLARELDAARNAGLLDVTLVDRAPLEFDTGPCLRFPQQAQFHPLKYLSALAQLIVQRGGKIFAQSPVRESRGGTNAYAMVKNGARVHAQDLVFATNTPINDLFVIHTKQAPYRTYVLAFAIEPGSVPRALFWDTADPYHYIRVARNSERVARNSERFERNSEPASEGEGSEVLIVGGEDHKSGQDSDNPLRFEELERWTRERFPQVGAVAWRWSGQIMEPVDGLAYIGSNPLDASNVFIVTGDSGNGMTHGTLASIVLSDLIMQRANPWAALYAPNRKTLSAAGEFLHENLNVAAQYTDWARPGNYSSPAAIPRDCGGIVREGAHMIAVYRDADDHLHSCNAACTHLGCVVAWNKVEQSWDCPCHGSRFDPYGRVLNGPAQNDLTRVAFRNAENAG